MSIERPLAGFVTEQFSNDPPLFEMRWFLEDQTPEALADLIVECNHKKQELDAIIKMAIDIKENGYGNLE